MKRADLVAALRAFARSLSPTAPERELVTSVYGAVGSCIGVANCLQIGSYPRFTSITPIHDLDVLFILGQWTEHADPSQALAQLETKLRADFKNPTQYAIKISRQTHSITITFSEGKDEVFSVDIVPAYRLAKNEFGDDTYVVPEIAVRSHRERRQIVEGVRAGTRQMTWIASDPRGYISVATSVNANNADFRKAVKLVKKWRSSWKEINPDFPLKSFHIEQIITLSFLAKPHQDAFDAVFAFFVDLPDRVSTPQIPDRADPNRMIDEYIAGLKQNDIQLLQEARDYALKELEAATTAAQVVAMFKAGRYRRPASEQFLFDDRIPTFSEFPFDIVANVQPRDGFRAFILDALGLIPVGRKIQFRAGGAVPPHDLLKWKVKNDNSSEQPRGEITDHGTRNDPENTKYKGDHYVECYAIRDGVCIGKARQSVVLKGPFA